MMGHRVSQSYLKGRPLLDTSINTKKWASGTSFETFSPRGNYVPNQSGPCHTLLGAIFCPGWQIALIPQDWGRAWNWNQSISHQQVQSTSKNKLVWVMRPTFSMNWIIQTWESKNAQDLKTKAYTQTKTMCLARSIPYHPLFSVLCTLTGISGKRSMAGERGSRYKDASPAPAWVTFSPPSLLPLAASYLFLLEIASRHYQGKPAFLQQDWSLHIYVLTNTALLLFFLNFFTEG